MNRSRRPSGSRFGQIETERGHANSRWSAGGLYYGRGANVQGAPIRFHRGD